MPPPTTTSIHHTTLNATFTGLNHQGIFTQYRGIKYGTVGERFALAELKGSWNGEHIDCTTWGPRCPQNKYDVGHLLREPEGDVFYDETEDEFGCLNLDVSVPATASSASGGGGGTDTSLLPVFFWVHGGSQIISYGNGASKIGDVRKLVEDSVECGKPIVVVSVQYRLNVFHVGDGEGTKNLGLKDLRTALDWVRGHIAGFGGNPEEVTLVGESAGAALVHALAIGDAGRAGKCSFKRVALMSGSLFMSRPQPEARTKAALIDPILAKVKEMGHDSLKTAPVQVLLDAQAEIPIRSVFLQQEPELEGCCSPQAEVHDDIQLMVGDCEFESILWRNGVEAMSAEQIVESFDKAGESSSKLKQTYHINATRPTQTRHGALDFINDKLWALPTMLLAQEYRKGGRKSYTYVFDQPNPWQASSRAHHAVDLVYLFGGFDLSHNASAEAVGREVRVKFIDFVNGEEPWSPEKTFAFGPVGQCKMLEPEELLTRRRGGALKVLKDLPEGDVMAALGSLVAGRISLLN